MRFFFSVRWKVRFFFFPPLLWNCFCFLANLLRQIFLQCWQGQEKNVAGGNQMSSIKSWPASQLAHSLWFLIICQKSCVVWKWRRDFSTKINSWIFWTAHVQSSNGNVLEGSSNSGLWDQLHHRSDYTTSIWSFQRIQVWPKHQRCKCLWGVWEIAAVAEEYTMYVFLEPCQILATGYNLLQGGWQLSKKLHSMFKLIIDQAPGPGSKGIRMTKKKKKIPRSAD